MADAYRLLQSERLDTLTRFCASHKLDIADVWVPLQLLRSTRGKDDTPVQISPATAVVLLNHATGQLFTRRSDILAHLPLLFVDASNLAIPPNVVPEGCIIFARATTGMSKKRLPKGITLLHRPITSTQAVAEGSALVEEGDDPQQLLRHTRTSTESATDMSTVAGGPNGSLGKRSKRARSDAVFEEHLQKALEASGSERAAHGSTIITETMANLIRVRDAVPLHFMTHGKTETSLRVKEVSWNIPDGRIMYRIFRRSGSSDASTKSTYTDAARFIAVFIIDNVLLRREPIHAYLQHGNPSWSLIDLELLTAAQKLVEKGYRIVLLDHYPSLHHGNVFALEAKLHPIAELCQKHFKCDVTVVLSTMSYISASHRRDGMPFVLPYSGVWQFFIAQLNGGLRADAESLLVGAAADDASGSSANPSSQGKRDAQFAMNCGLRYVDGAALKQELRQS
ncbi:hypothetical protein DQ04_01941080 [Trypanosoma grayi]|uniref:hypothetical protein n=1 Tax=Trypanosoma grayi TaxID=71804 RepID=UPI0004F4B3F5|nr:hypothetical protein DQ04_01941080 [Trypanosoma grayi]KEG12161.1 hypothetical protein DQ04_01941080 [Trypanosoma grayi]